MNLNEKLDRHLKAIKEELHWSQHRGFDFVLDPDRQDVAKNLNQLAAWIVTPKNSVLFSDDPEFGDWHNGFSKITTKELGTRGVIENGVCFGAFDEKIYVHDASEVNNYRRSMKVISSRYPAIRFPRGMKEFLDDAEKAFRKDNLENIKTIIFEASPTHDIGYKQNTAIVVLKNDSRSDRSMPLKDYIEQ